MGGVQDYMELNNITKNNKSIISIIGKINAITAPEFEQYLKTLVNNGILKIILDFSKVDYISSAGLRAILVITKLLKTKSGSIVLASLKPEVKNVFEISGFTSIIPVVEDIEEAESKL